MSEPESRLSAPCAGRGPCSRFLLKFPPFASALRSMPPRRRAALYYESLADLGFGSLMRVFPIALVVLETILNAELWYQGLLASLFYGANLLSPIFTWSARHVRVRWLVIVPNVLIALFLLGIAVRPGSAGAFTFLVCLVLGLRVASQIGEMNMYRLIYPANKLSHAVGWTRAVAAFSGFVLTLLSWLWLELFPEYYWGLFWCVALATSWGCWFYLRIPVHRSNFFGNQPRRTPLQAFREGVKIFFKDRRFRRYELAFLIVGFANQMSIYLVPNTLNVHVGAGTTQISLIAIVIPSLTMILTGPIWGAYLSQHTPMTVRGVFSLMQIVSFSLYAWGGATGQVWPFFVGSFVHSVSIAGGNINWLTGNSFFAKPEHYALYNGIHVFLTGVRGCVAPLVARIIYEQGVLYEEMVPGGIAGWGWGTHIFWIAAGL
ncbi:MAG TPA: MFS transporter, partial [Planctomycetaceae bacterium]|nr:MFS transporter [Planctomycetaceae bacterium]